MRDQFDPPFAGANGNPPPIRRRDQPQIRPVRLLAFSDGGRKAVTAVVKAGAAAHPRHEHWGRAHR
ncbi:hypothetical protein HH310_03710 [Actinoplanes sp. TBRC 11911]|nr:hypothetical protein [Actinoplanes sp. TBRC 11911]